MVIQHNISAINAHRNLGINNNATAKNLEKLSSGYRINRAGDDAAGLAISEKMRGQIRGLSMAEQNTSHAINLIQTAEGGLQETHAILQRMRELAVQSANGTYDNEVDRYNLQKEYEALMDEIDRIAESTHYNGINLLDGSLGLGSGSKGAVANLSLAETEAYMNGLVADISALTYTPAGLADGNYRINLVFAADGTVDYGASSISGIGTDGYKLQDNGGNLEIVNASGTVVGSLDLDTTSGADLVFDDAQYLADTGKTFDYGTLTIDLSIKGTDVATNYRGLQVKNADGDGTTGLTFQIGANGSKDQRVSLFVENMGSNYLGNVGMDTGATHPGFNADGDPVEYWDVIAGETLRDTTIAGQDDAKDVAIAIVDHAINQVSSTRADLGALQNRLEHTLNNLGVTKENLTAAESTIRDVDMAAEMMEYTKNSILVQASQAMLAQANMLPQGVLQLLS